MFKEMNTLKPFFEDPNREFHVRQIAKILKITPATASKRLKQLKGILKYRKEITADFYKANLDNEDYRDLKVYYNIRKIKDVLLEPLNKFYLKPTIILFGSASKGLDTKESDFDILILTDKKQHIDLTKYKINREIQLLVHKNLKELKNPHLINNVLNGIVIQGEIKWT